jgi:putative Mg2+ transporter-C (MgtC) family protein
MDFLQSHEQYLHEIELAGRLVLAMLLALPLGLDREVRDHPAGLRTHMLTALAAALFTIVALELYVAVRDTSERMTADPVRAIEAVTAGVAFLAAGTIIQSRGRVRGLTTGASMWLAGALGLASGAGYYVVAVIACILSVIVLNVLARVEKRFLDRRREQDD